MERIVFLLILIVICLIASPTAKCEEVMSMSTLVTPQNINFEQCNKKFNLPAERLFYLTIASINANKFSVDEVQTKSGYILFTAIGKQYLARIVKLDNNRSLLKVTPANNIYYFQPGIVLNLFKYIDVNSLEPMVQVPRRS